MSARIELLLFSRDPALVQTADRAGIDGFIIDWEDRARFERQHPADEPEDADTREDLRRIRSVTRRPVWCRINQPGPWSEAEVEQAIAEGADLVLLPMVRRPEEAEDVLALVAGRAQTGLIVETVEACACAPALATLPLDRVYVGLFDLLQSRGGGALFDPLTDGTVERLRKVFHTIPFGVAGLTTVDGGAPMPCLELMGHLHRLGCNFTFLRNAFKRDIVGRDMAEELKRLRASWKQLSLD